MDSIVLRDGPEEFGDVVLGERVLLAGLEAGRYTPCTCFEALVQEFAHPPELAWGSRLFARADRCEPQLSVRDEARHVDRGPAFIQTVEVLLSRLPGDWANVVVGVD